MSCKIKIPFTNSINALYNLGTAEAKAHSGQLIGDVTSGFFSIPALGGIFEGVYEVNNNIIEIEIYKKPFLIPCMVIETFLKSNIK